MLFSKEQPFILNKVDFLIYLEVFRYISVVYTSGIAINNTARLLNWIETYLSMCIQINVWYLNFLNNLREGMNLWKKWNKIISTIKPCSTFWELRRACIAVLQVCVNSPYLKITSFWAHPYGRGFYLKKCNKEHHLSSKNYLGLGPFLW